MKSLKNHIILIGFKHTGKSVIAEELAKKLDAPFVDLDKRVELLYENNTQQKCSCRDIMLTNGQAFFRELETQALSQTVSEGPSIISLGGGTPLSPQNQRIIKPYLLIHVTAPKGIVYERILVSGRPAFLGENEDIFESFNRLWNERIKIYEKIEDFSVVNDGEVESSVNSIIQKLDLKE